MERSIWFQGYTEFRRGCISSPSINFQYMTLKFSNWLLHLEQIVMRANHSRKYAFKAAVNDVATIFVCCTESNLQERPSIVQLK